MVLDLVRKSEEAPGGENLEYEPSNPIPILLNRARRLVGADFLTILKDLAPQGLENVKLVGGLASKDA